MVVVVVVEAVVGGDSGISRVEGRFRWGWEEAGCAGAGYRPCELEGGVTGSVVLSFLSLL